MVDAGAYPKLYTVVVPATDVDNNVEMAVVPGRVIVAYMVDAGAKPRSKEVLMKVPA